MLITVDMMMEIYAAFRQDHAPLGLRMMGPEQNDMVLAILSEMRRKFGDNYLETDDEKLRAETEKFILNYKA